MRVWIGMVFAGSVSASGPANQLPVRPGSNGSGGSQTAHRSHQQNRSRNTWRARECSIRRRSRPRKEGNDIHQNEDLLTLWCERKRDVSIDKKSNGSPTDKYKHLGATQHRICPSEGNLKGGKLAIASIMVDSLGEDTVSHPSSSRHFPAVRCPPWNVHLRIPII